MVLDLDSEETVAAARNSPFLDVEVVKHFIEILEMNRVESDFNQRNREYTLQTLKTYILRGFKNIISSL